MAARPWPARRKTHPWHPATGRWPRGRRHRGRTDDDGARGGEAPAPIAPTPTLPTPLACAPTPQPQPQQQLLQQQQQLRRPAWPRARASGAATTPTAAVRARRGAGAGRGGRSEPADSGTHGRLGARRPNLGAACSADRATGRRTMTRRWMKLSWMRRRRGRRVGPRRCWSWTSGAVDRAVQRPVPACHSCRSSRPL